jgi:hypothetical protein
MREKRIDLILKSLDSLSKFRQPRIAHAQTRADGHGHVLRELVSSAV